MRNNLLIVKRFLESRIVLVPSSFAAMTDVTSSLITITYTIQPEDCDFLLGTINFAFNITFRLYPSNDYRLYPTSLNSTECQRRRQILFNITMSPSLEFMVSTDVCYTTGKCGDKTTFQGKTLSSGTSQIFPAIKTCFECMYASSEALPLDRQNIKMQVYDSSIHLSWVYSHNNCTGRTTFILLATSEIPACAMKSDSIFLGDCSNNDVRVNLMVDGLCPDLQYNLSVEAEVKGATTTKVADLTAITQRARRK